MGKKRITTVIAAIVLAVTALLAGSSSLADKTGTVKGGWLILRASPSLGGQIRSSYPSGTVVSILGQKGSWYFVTAPDGLTGYMLGDYLQINGEEGLTPAVSTAYVTSSNGLNVRLRKGPGKNYSVIASFAPGTECKILTEGNTWCRIQIGSFNGYMMTRFLTKATPSQQTSEQSSDAVEYPVYVTSENGKGVNLRSGPNKGFSSIGFYSVGTQALMITKGTTWSYIRVGDRYGYMMTRFLTTERPQEKTSYVVSTNGRNVNLRTAPSKKAKIIKSFKVGTKLTVLLRGREWCYVQIKGYKGYMMREFISDQGNYATPTDLY